MGLLDRIKEEVKNSGQNKGKFIYFRPDAKVRVRFLQELEDGKEITFHDSFEKNIKVPCQEQFGKSCPYCEIDGLRTRAMFAWSVWDYDAKEVKVLLEPVNQYSPVPNLAAMYENYGTTMDRDFVITQTGKGTNKGFTVIPMDKVKFRNVKAKPFSEKTLFTLLQKAFPVDPELTGDYDDDYEDDEEVETKKKTKTKAKRKQPEPELEEDDDDYEFDDEDEDDVSGDVDYSELTPKELFLLCKEREIKAPPKKPAKFYIGLLEEYDEAHDDWDEEEDDDEEWE